MEINLNVIPRPLAGHEAEYEELIDWINAAKYAGPDQPNPYTSARSASLFRFWRKKIVFDFDAALARFETISESMHVRLNPPVVGRDKEADAWLCDAYREGRITAKSETKALEKFDGYRVLQLLPECDGFPVYCSFEKNSEVDRTSFYGSVLERWDELEGTGLITDMYGPLLASELAAWAEKLRAWADDFAKTHNMFHIIGDRGYYAEDPSGPDTCLHIVDQLARWASYWSDRGHGSEPIFDFRSH